MTRRQRGWIQMADIGRSRGFTLTEVLVSAVVIAVLSATGLRMMDALGRVEDRTEDENIAANLLQKSFEEIREAAPVYYDQLNQCDFVKGNACGLESSLPESFTRFERHMRVEDMGSTELKRITVEVSWTARGSPHTLIGTMLLARPAEPLPGNLIGLVRRPGGRLLGNVRLRLKYMGPDKRDAQTYSSWTYLPRDDGEDINYDFSSGYGQFRLKPGMWSLRATKGGFYPVTFDHIKINPREETRFDFVMRPKPKPPKPPRPPRNRTRPRRPPTPSPPPPPPGGM